MASKSLQNLLTRLVSMKYFLPYDIFERHKFIGGLVPNGVTIMDVGGSMSQLSKFSSPGKITTIDIKPPADIVYDGDKIPSKDNSFDLITSIDVLEHVPPSARDNFVNEVYRVAKNKVIISAPLGTEKHTAYEKKTLEYAKKHSISVPYLEEHVANGLPKPKEIEAYAKKYNGTIYYAGNLDLGEILFKIHTFEVKNKYLNYITFFIKLVFNSIINVTLYPYLTNKEFSENVNRFYLILEKNNKID